MAIQKGALAAVAAAVGVAFVGLVGYKIVKKKNPKLLNKAKESVKNIKKRTSKVLEGAKKSFEEGYASA